MAQIKFKTDKKGDFAERSTFEMVEQDFVGVRDRNQVKAIVQLLSPKSASLTNSANIDSQQKDTRTQSSRGQVSRWGESTLGGDCKEIWFLPT
jgi:hypothetical protein